MGVAWMINEGVGPADYQETTIGLGKPLWPHFPLCKKEMIRVKSLLFLGPLDPVQKGRPTWQTEDRREGRRCQTVDGANHVNRSLSQKTAASSRLAGHTQNESRDSRQERKALKGSAH